MVCLLSSIMSSCVISQGRCSGEHNRTRPFAKAAVNKVANAPLAATTPLAAAIPSTRGRLRLPVCHDVPARQPASSLPRAAECACQLGSTQLLIPCSTKHKGRLASHTPGRRPPHTWGASSLHPHPSPPCGEPVAVHLRHSRSHAAPPVGTHRVPSRRRNPCKPS